MKFPKQCLFLLLLLPFVTGYSQNIVPNPSFEDYSALPDGEGQWDRSDYWTNAGGTGEGSPYATPDYFHMDGSSPVQLPACALAMVNPHTGDAIMGFLGYHTPFGEPTDIREYLMVEFTTPMIIDSTYKLSFWITNGESGVGHFLKCDGIALNLSTEPLDQTGPSFIDRTPQVEIEGQFFTNEWEEITFYYLADSAYTHLTIGNFYSDDEIETSVAVEGPLPFSGAYYFVDDFSVELSDLDVSGIPEESKFDFMLYPNPSNDITNILLNNSSKQALFTLSSINGKILKSGKFVESIQLSLADFSPGIYLIDVEIGDIIIQKKLIKQ